MKSPNPKSTMLRLIIGTLSFGFLLTSCDSCYCSKNAFTCSCSNCECSECEHNGFTCNTDCLKCTWYPFLIGCYSTASGERFGSDILGCEGADCVFCGCSFTNWNCPDYGNEYGESIAIDKDFKTEKAGIGVDYRVIRGNWYNSQGYMSTYLDTDTGSLSEFASAANYILNVLTNQFNPPVISCVFEVETKVAYIESVEIEIDLIMKRPDCDSTR